MKGVTRRHVLRGPASTEQRHKEATWEVLMDGFSCIDWQHSKYGICYDTRLASLSTTSYLHNTSKGT